MRYGFGRPIKERPGPAPFSLIVVSRESSEIRCDCLVARFLKFGSFKTSRSSWRAFQLACTEGLRRSDSIARLTYLGETSLM